MEATAVDRREPLVRLVGWRGEPNPATRDVQDGGPAAAGAARLASVAALAIAGTTGGPVLAGPGDLDPAFGDVGRVLGLPDGQLWSLEVRDDESILFGGGGSEYCWYYYDCDVFETLGRLDAFGEPDAAFTPANLDHTYVYDTAWLDDGRVVGTGFARGTDGRDRLAVFRLLPNGALDTTFALTGHTVLAGGTGNEVGNSVLVESDGRVVVAGTRNGNLIVARFLANGSPDPAFGNQGLFQLPAGTWSGGYPARLASAPGGGYRVLSNLAASTSAPCSVVGLTPSGTADAAFGANGVRVTPVEHPGQTYCVSFATLPGGATVVAGSDGPRAYLARVLADGTLDATFDSTPVADRLAGASALAVSSTGRIFVAGADGSGLSGATVVRLLANGALDAAFGQGGSTTLEARTQRAAPMSVHDMQVRANDALVLAGDTNYGFAPVIARLLGDVGLSGPGVLGIVEYSAFQLEQDGPAVVTVRRTGGAAGNVGVSYRARAVDGGGATAGQDFTAVSGELTWADGDTSEREIAVPITEDTEEERPERFEIVLESPTGGAGLGAMGADIEIAGSSYPAGDFAFTSDLFQGQEGGSLSISVSRLYYTQGPVSVEVRVVGGDAEANTDFSIVGGDASNTVVLTWEDGEVGQQSFDVSVARDTADEPLETIRFELASPTGGALVGVPSQATLRIMDATPTPPSGDSGGSRNRGSGVFAGIEALLLAMLAALRRRWGAARRS